LYSKYAKALIDLLDNAKESIVVSMYGISAGEKLKRLEDVLKFVKSNTEISGIPDYLEDLPEEAMPLFNLAPEISSYDRGSRKPLMT